MCLLNKECKTEKAIAIRIQKECLAYIRDSDIRIAYLARKLDLMLPGVKNLLEQEYWGIEKAMRIASALNFNLSMTIYYPNVHFPRG